MLTMRCRRELWTRINTYRGSGTVYWSTSACPWPSDADSEARRRRKKNQKDLSDLPLLTLKDEPWSHWRLCRTRLNMAQSQLLAKRAAKVMLRTDPCQEITTSATLAGIRLIPCFWHLWGRGTRWVKANRGKAGAGVVIGCRRSDILLCMQCFRFSRSTGRHSYDDASSSNLHLKKMSFVRWDSSLWLNVLL